MPSKMHGAIKNNPWTLTTFILLASNLGRILTLRSQVMQEPKRGEYLMRPMWVPAFNISFKVST